MFINLGQFPLSGNRQGDYFRDNMTISCEFNDLVIFYNLKQDETVVILGEYHNFDNRPEFNGINLINCRVMSTVSAKVSGTQFDWCRSRDSP